MLELIQEYEAAYKQALADVQKRWLAYSVFRYMRENVPEMPQMQAHGFCRDGRFYDLISLLRKGGDDRHADRIATMLGLCEAEINKIFDV